MEYKTDTNIEARYYPDVEMNWFPYKDQAEKALKDYKKIHPDWNNIRIVEKKDYYYLTGSCFGFAKMKRAALKGNEGETVLDKMVFVPEARNWNDLNQYLNRV